MDEGGSPAQTEPYRMCVECGATWWTENEWRAAVERLAREMRQAGYGDWPVDYNQPFCCECPHDL